MRKTKFYALVLAAAMAVAGFAGCSDEENKDNGEGTKEPTENVDTKEKRVMTIREEYYDEHGKMWDSYTLGFRYDAQGRVDTIITNGTRKEVLTYEENRVTGTSEGFVRECTFKNGLVAKEQFEGIEGRRTFEYSYADGRLSSMKITGLLNQTENDVTTMEVMTDGSGNWVGVNSTYPVESEDHADAQNIYTITMSNVENNLNLDLMGLFFGGENEIGLLLGFAGERSPKLIAEMLSKETLESSEEVYTDLYTFSYQVDEDGYLREIRAELREEGELSDVTIYKIGYEEGDVSIVIPGEDEEGNEDDENPGGNVEEPEIKKRKIVKIRYTYGGGYSNCDSLVYDEKGRVKSVFAFNAEGEVKETGIKYDEDMVRISYDGDEWLQLYLKDGVVKWGGMDDEVEILCDYTDGYFTGIKYSISDGKIDGIVKGEDIYAHWYFDGMEGNCARVITDIEDEMERGFFIELSEVENNMNLDLFNQETFMLMDLNESWLCGIFGKRVKYLPKSIKWVYEDGSTDVCEYSYKVDEEGYVTEMKAIYSDGALDVLEYIYEE